MVARELVSRLVARGHDVDVVTTTLRDVAGRPGRRTRVETVDGARVTYLATPLRYRWMGITPTLPLELRRLPRPDVTHVMGFRDPVTTGVAAWCRLRRVPYVFEPVGMFGPRLRKVRAQAGLRLDADARRRLGRAARGRVVAEGARRRRGVRASTRSAFAIRANAFPEPPPPGDVDPLDGRRARRRPGRPLRRPDRGREGRRAPPRGGATAPRRPRRARRPGRPARDAGARWRPRRRDPRTAGRVHLLPPTPGPPFDLYRRADVFVLASGGENFGLVAAEAASVGTPVVVSDRTGVAASFGDGEALVVPYDAGRDGRGDRPRPRRRRAAAATRGGRAPRGAALDVGRRRRRAADALRRGARD